MTRQNLQSHLSWLLRDSALTKPTPPILPSIGDSSALRTSQNPSFTSNSSFGSSLSQKAEIPDDQDTLKTAPKAVKEREVAGVISRYASQDDDNMGRLASASKSRKPSLVSRAERPPSPSTKVQKSVRRKQEDTETTKGGFWNSLL